MKKDKQNKQISNKTKYIFAGVVVAFLIVIVTIFLLFPKKDTIVPINNDGTTTTSVVLKNFTATELAKYDGTNPDLPIYIALNGDVYDVTPGRKFYETGGSYHYLAGRDSSEELNQIGGYIIKRKYTVIGKFIQ